ncbi:uncharacterized protein BDZ83DRAFT_252328 [Colletotrichum acutatum]|uniref:Uncharacterized protein n=1 Tax=Glomerella acutata TaxID=27357 RepID=A0AAD8UMU2_GLOAC|nr:uncharacterized protein BDZ83DRAFT_252328 [Colletotrichum acutatum]KAK1726726.1 hypothetical protein BDZ83DRAFT_252328 [Colletotrichum acutatum]
MSTERKGGNVAIHEISTYPGVRCRLRTYLSTVQTRARSSTPTGWHPHRLPSHCICIAWLLNTTLISDWAAFVLLSFSDSEDDTPLTQHHLVLCPILPRKTSERRVGVAQPSTGHPQGQKSKRRYRHRHCLFVRIQRNRAPTTIRGMPPPARPSIPSRPGGPFQASSSQKQELISAQTRFVHLQFDLILMPKGRLVAINPPTPTSFLNQMDSIDVRPDIVRDAYGLPTSSLQVRTRPISIAAVSNMGGGVKAGAARPHTTPR